MSWIETLKIIHFLSGQYNLFPSPPPACQEDQVVNKRKLSCHVNEFSFFYMFDCEINLWSRYRWNIN